MANFIEKTRDYAGNLASKTFGRAAWLEPENDPNDEPELAMELKYYGAAAQILCPATHRCVMDLLQTGGAGVSKYGHFWLPAVLGAAGIDAAFMVVAGKLGTNPAETIALKFGANAATNAGLDLAKTTLDRIKHLRTPASPNALSI